MYEIVFAHCWHPLWQDAKTFEYSFLCPEHCILFLSPHLYIYIYIFILFCRCRRFFAWPRIWHRDSARNCLPSTRKCSSDIGHRVDRVGLSWSFPLYGRLKNLSLDEHHSHINLICLVDSVGQPSRLHSKCVLMQCRKAVENHISTRKHSSFAFKWASLGFSLIFSLDSDKSWIVLVLWNQGKVADLSCRESFTVVNAVICAPPGKRQQNATWLMQILVAWLQNYLWMGQWNHY